MSARLVAWIVGALALYVVLSFVAPGPVALLVFALAVPIVIVAKLLAGRHEKGMRDAAETLVVGSRLSRRRSHIIATAQMWTGAPH